MEEREKYPTAALRRKARRLRWKQEKAARRPALKDHYRDAPWIIRVPRLYLLKPFIALLIIAALGFGAVKVVPNMFVNSMFENKNNPAFDIIGFDACLMSSLEVTHALDGFASYYALSEEVEPGEGWDYTPWLKAMSEDPTMSPVQVARQIADTYMDFYMTQNVNMGWLYSNDVTFAVLDAAKARKLYDAWCELTKKQITDAAKDNSVLAEIGRCSDKSTHFATTAYNIYNTIDLGNYVDQMVDVYPEESSRIKNLIKDAVMYHRVPERGYAEVSGNADGREG